MRISESSLRRLIREMIVTEAVSDWDPDNLPRMFDEAFSMHAVLRNDPQVEQFATRGGLMYKSFLDLQRAAKAADTIASSVGPEDSDPARQEALDGTLAVKDAALQMQDMLGGRHKGLQALIEKLSDISQALDLAVGEEIPTADVGDLYEPL